MFTKVNYYYFDKLFTEEFCDNVINVGNDLKDQEGIADTDLHPSGWMRTKDQRLFVISEGDFIDKDKKIIILSVDGNRVLVREVEK